MIAAPLTKGHRPDRDYWISTSYSNPWCLCCHGKKQLPQINPFASERLCFDCSATVYLLGAVFS